MSRNDPVTKRKNAIRVQVRDRLLDGPNDTVTLTRIFWNGAFDPSGLLYDQAPNYNEVCGALVTMLDRDQAEYADGVWRIKPALALQLIEEREAAQS